MTYRSTVSLINRHACRRTTKATKTIKSFSFSSKTFDHPYSNVPPSVAEKVGRKLHLRPHHPLNRIKVAIEEYWELRSLDDSHRENKGGGLLTVYDDLDPVVTTSSNFDVLRIPPEHPSRSKSDTYYVDQDRVLRTHTSAHQVELLRRLPILSDTGEGFLVTGDVYRRDEVDASHYPVFHQMEGVKIFPGTGDRERDLKIVEEDLVTGLEGMVRRLFGDVEIRWGPDHFPFTDPSFELEILFDSTHGSDSNGIGNKNQRWLEVLGCGVVHPDVLRAANRPSTDVGWAFGLGLERLAMILYGIPDIRLFWTDDARFHSQFVPSKLGGDATEMTHNNDDNLSRIIFRPYSKYPPCFKDISFWLPPHHESNNFIDKLSSNEQKMSPFHPNDLMEIIREVAGDFVERVELVDEFIHPRSGRQSHCYRISYRSMDRNLTNAEVDAWQEEVRERTQNALGVELR